MAINTKFLPQLLVYNDDEAKKIVRNLKKVKIKNEYQLVDLGITEYVSVPKLDQKAFRYVERNGQMYLRESVYSVGGLVQDSVLIHLGEFTEGDNEVGEGLEYIAKIKDAKAKQRKKQLRECERIAMNTLNQINKQVKNSELLSKWQSELNEAKRFVRLGKEDYYQSQVDIISKMANEDENLAKIIVDYNTKINQKNEKWLEEPLKLGKNKNSVERIGTQGIEDIGEINPKNRELFNQYYDARSIQMAEYLTSEEEVTSELPIAPEIIYQKQEDTLQKINKEPENIISPQKITSLQKLKRTFTKTEDGIEMSR